jgi:hypothetical protein
VGLFRPVMAQLYLYLYYLLLIFCLHNYYLLIILFAVGLNDIFGTDIFLSIQVSYCNFMFTNINDLFLFVKVKGKADPLQTWSGPEVSRNLRFTDFMTTAEDGGKIFSLRHRPPLPPGNKPGTHLY